MESEMGISAEEVKQMLSRFFRGQAPDIHVEVKNGTVVLHGQVERLAEKMVAEDLIRRLDGVHQVENGLWVKQEENCSDAEVERSVREVLNSKENLKHLEANVDGGVVHLNGEVSARRDEEQARRLVARVRGVTDVVSHLDTTGAGDEDFNLVHQAAEAVAKDQRIESEGMMLEAAGGEIYLKGWIPSQQMKDAAEARVEAVEGVREVHNHLVVEEEQDDRDAYLTNVLQQVMDQHPDPGLGQVRALVVRGTAYLFGEVDSVDTKENLLEIVNQTSENFDGLESFDDDVDIRVH